MKIIPLFALLTALTLSVSCSAEPPIDDPSVGRWEQLVLKDAPPRRDLLLACEQAISQAGYPKGTTDALRGTVFSDWQVRLQPFRHQGMRYKGIFRVFEREGEIAVRTRVIAERNVEPNDTLDASAAEWEPLNDDQARSRILMQFLRSQLYLRDN